MNHVSLHDLHNRAEAIPDEDSRERDGGEGEGTARHSRSPDTARYLWHTWFMGKMTDEERAEFEAQTP